MKLQKTARVIRLCRWTDIATYIYYLYVYLRNGPPTLYSGPMPYALLACKNYLSKKLIWQAHIKENGLDPRICQNWQMVNPPCYYLIKVWMTTCSFTCVCELRVLYLNKTHFYMLVTLDSESVLRPVKWVCCSCSGQLIIKMLLMHWFYDLLWP